jgi:hypothetical protein
MKPTFFFAIAALVLSGCQALPMAQNKPVPPTAAQSRPANVALAGQFAGKWIGVEGTAGELRIKLRQEAGAAWVGEAMFTYDGAEIPGKVKTLETEGTKLRMVFDWEIQGTAGQSTLNGELIGDTLKGTYETRGAAGASRGTWNTTRG